MIKTYKILFLLLLITSCSVQPKPTIQITHVLAVTQQGDTLTIPIDVIRPVNYKIINYSYDYGWSRPYYYNYHRDYNYNYSSPRKLNNKNNTDKNINKIVPREDPGDKKPSGSVLMKGNK